MIGSNFGRFCSYTNILVESPGLFPIVHCPFVSIFTDMLEHLGWDVGREEETFLHYNSLCIDSYLYNGYEKVHLGSVCVLLIVSASCGLKFYVEYI